MRHVIVRMFEEKNSKGMQISLIDSDLGIIETFSGGDIIRVQDEMVRYCNTNNILIVKDEIMDQVWARDSINDKWTLSGTIHRDSN